MLMADRRRPRGSGVARCVTGIHGLQAVSREPRAVSVVRELSCPALIVPRLSFVALRFPVTHRYPREFALVRGGGGVRIRA